LRAGLATRAQALSALSRTADAVVGIAGEHQAISLTVSLAQALLDGPGPFTRQEVATALNNTADDAKGIYNPGGGECSDTVIADSIGDLIVNLAAGLDEVIAAQWHDLDPDLNGYQIWSTHANDLGDHCPWSGQQVGPNREVLMSGLAGDDQGCPQGCPSAAWTAPERGAPPHKAAIAATVKGWIS
jgi:hypothetical protein